MGTIETSKDRGAHREPAAGANHRACGKRTVQPLSVMDTGGMEPGRVVEQLKDAYASSALFAAEFPEGDFRSRIENWALPGLALTRQTSDANKIFLTGGKRFSVPDLIYVRMNLEGSVRGVFEDRSYVAGPGDISILRSTDLGLTEFTRRQTLAFYLPRSTLLSRPDARLPDVIRGTSPAGRLLGSAVREFDKALADTPVAEAGALASSLTQVFRALLETTGLDMNREDFRDAQFKAVAAHIDTNIARSELDSNEICRAFGLSRATLYRMFRDWQGVDSFILGRRLRRVYEDLSTAAEELGTVSHIAERWGFHNPSKFTKQFRRHFGQTPSDVLGLEHRSETTPADKKGARRQSSLDQMLSGLA